MRLNPWVVLVALFIAIIVNPLTFWGLSILGAMCVIAWHQATWGWICWTLVGVGIYVRVCAQERLAREEPHGSKP